MAFLEGSRSVAEGSEPVAVEASETFEDFYVREYPAVVGLAYALSGSRSGAEDLAQEAFLAAHRGWDRIGGFDEPGVWVRRVVANLSVSTIRRRVVETKALARHLYDQVGVGPADMDAAMIYENFSPVVFLQLEGLGFCGPGEARDFIVDGNIDLDGALPVNTHGGLLGEAYIHGMNNILEGVRQIRGTAVNRVAGAETVMVAGGRSGLILQPAD